MLDAILITTYMAVVALLLVLVAREYRLSRIWKTWRQHDSFYGERD